MLRAPMRERCEQARLKGCPDVVDGIVLYIEGDEPAAMQKLKAGAAQNSPEDIRRFSEILLRSSGIPGASEFAGPITQISKVLISEATSSQVRPTFIGAKVSASTTVPANMGDERPESTVSAVPSKGPTRSDLALYALTAPVDPTRTETESVGFTTDTEAAACVVAGAEAGCEAVRAGPLLVTDLLSISGCPGRLFIGSGMPNDKGEMGLRWFAEATPGGLTGARLFVGRGEWLQIIRLSNPKANAQDPRCVLTWSGYRPRMVPGKI